MTFVSLMRVGITLFLPVIGSKPLPINTTTSTTTTTSTFIAHTSSDGVAFATRAEGGGGGGIGIGAIIGIIIAVIAILLLILFFLLSNRSLKQPNIHPGSIPYNTAPPAYNASIPATKTYYPSQKAYPTLPRYNGHTSPGTAPIPPVGTTYVQGHGVQYPSAVHTSGGYYGRENKVRFGGAGVRHY
ncbi:uncharacterized protein I303_105320 [Kwoniella dejecticola CBS 10117]|uniref:Uncharacterized protein n=1 Tax=Kwoniella dejecticola CBS 10117 TaxID=1296121 RepID=A0A1A6A2T8_9TREE|nr:uncharacterized protein I303_05233 [Kwoniella dejecticola CBS 10117]OBR84375.1 hypothetical protein I303_05233 [Kwoniella dejecticola CBS 10117]